ncbi:unnamed protein product [Merluccius merluccius]
MTCVEKRHLGHRTGSMLHHRFPNGFTELLMDETDREVSTLTDRAFRSLCVGDDAVYNDEFAYGFSPFNCHKPLVGEPRKKSKESKKQGQSQHHGNNGGKDTQPWKQKQQSMTKVSSFLKALSATEKSCAGIFKNGDVKDSNGESWDKSALRSIQKELSEFSADYHNTLADGHFGRNDHHRHPSGDGSATKTGKDTSKVKNGKSTIKLRKLNIKNFFLHSEFSPFQMWRDINRFPFGREAIMTSIPSDKDPKWYDSPLYRELAEAHSIDILNAEDSQPCLRAMAKEPSPSAEGVEPCQRAVTEPPPPVASKPYPPPPPPKVPPKPTVTVAAMRCSSEGMEGNAAPWRQNKSRSRNNLSVNAPGVIPPPQGRSSKTIEESVVHVKQEAKYVEVKAIEEVNSLASTPFSICQLMTPLIPSRQPTETSEILQMCLDLPLRPDSEAKLTPELPVKRESYKSLASSILFNLKDNRKRVKSRYSPPKFRTSEMPDRGTQSPRMDNGGHTNMGSDGFASGFSTPAILIEGQPCCTPILKQANNTPSIVPGKDLYSPLSNDYLITNLLHTKREAAGSRGLGEENHLAPIMPMKNNKSPMAIKRNYPSLNLYKKSISADNGTGQLQVPLSAQSVSPDNRRQLLEQRNGLLPDATNRQALANGEAVNAALSPNIVQRLSPKVAAGVKVTSPHIQEKEGLANAPNLPENTRSEKQSKDIAQFIAGNDTSSQPQSTMDVIKAARDAINAEKHKALSASQLGCVKNKVSEPQEKLTKRNAENSKEVLIEDRSVIEPNHHLHPNKTDGSDDIVYKNNNVKRGPPPVPKRNFTKSDFISTLGRLSNAPSPTDDYLIERDLCNAKKDSLPTNVSEPVRKDGRLKHIFSARQNNYIKSQRYAAMEKEQEEVHNEGKTKVRVSLGKKEEMLKDSEHIINDLHALKELERARRGDVILGKANEKAKDELGAVNIDEEAKAKNDMIARELRNIKKGMLSMRGNTQAKRDMFTKKEQELNKQHGFTKIDSNAIVNKALINDNYDRAKMALEEVISERQKYKSTKEQDADPLLPENTGTERGYTPRIMQREKVSQESMADTQENQNGRMLRDMELRERLGDLRDHNHIKQILSQTEARLGETHQLGAKMPVPGMNSVTGDLNKRPTNKSKHVNNGTEKVIDHSHIPELELKNNIVRPKISEENGGKQLKDNKENIKMDVPSVPPRSKKGVIRKDEINIKESESAMDQTDDEFSIKENPKNKTASIKEVNTDSRREEQNSDILNNKLLKNNDMVMSIAEGDPIISECLISSELQTKNKRISPKEERGKEIKTYSKESPCSLGSPEQRKVKRKAPLRPDDPNTAVHLNQESVITENTATANLMAAEADQTTKAEIILDQEAAIDIPRNIVSPLLLANGHNINQSPPDQASLSSKSSYFSVESAHHRNTEVYHSLENLTAELEEKDGEPVIVSGNPNSDSATTGTDHVSVCDRETEVCKPSLKSPHAENEEPDREVSIHVGGGGGDGGIGNIISQQTKGTNNSTPMSPASTLSSPSLEIPALFIVKDNTFLNKPVKPVHLWLPKEHLISSDLGALHPVKKNLPLSNNAAITSSNSSHNIIMSSTPDEVSSQTSTLNSLSPSSVSNDNVNLRKSQFGPTLSVPQEEDRNSGVSPLSDGVESVATSAVETGDELVAGVAVTEDGSEVSKMPSERSGSPSSASGSQTGPSKPPPVLPKSEKALLKAMKLTTRRIKKEEGQSKPSHKSSHGSRKHRAVKHSADNPENIQTEDKRSISSRRHAEKLSQSVEREHRHKNEERYHPNESSHNHRHAKTKTAQVQYPQRDQSNDRWDHSRVDRSGYKTEKRGQDRTESNGRSGERLPDVVLTEREGRSSDRHRPRDKPDHRNYSSDRVISNVPVYKAHVDERPAADRQFKRSQSMDRYVGDPVERRASMDMSETTESRNQRIEKSIMEELQQRGRAKDRAGRGDALVKRSHSIDAYASEASHPPNLSRQSSYSGQQLSRQSSVEHTIVTQSIPMTQRKLLQDPDSGQYFFVDMPVQVKTKTFYDPETGNYVQLPVQPPEGAIPQAPTVEVLNAPMVLYHGFVPVPMPSIAHKSVVQATQMEQEDFERRQKERSRQVYSNEGRPYLEPVYGQHDHMLGEFLGVEELDCAS